MNILLFAGTKNGRELALILAEMGHEVHVSSASAYGNSLLAEHPRLIKHTGQLTGGDIVDKIHESGIHRLIDSTHPYAAEVSKNLIEASRVTGVPLIRFERKEVIPKTVGHHFKTVAQACDHIREGHGKALFTTGVKDLSEIVGHLGVERVIARVLPMESSRQQAAAAGLPKEQVLALKPPFTVEENLAHLEEFDAKYLVTKDSGKEGNIEEKMAAATQAGIELIVIDRPVLDFDRVVYSVDGVLEGLYQSDHKPL